MGHERPYSSSQGEIFLSQFILIKSELFLSQGMLIKLEEIHTQLVSVKYVLSLNLQIYYLVSHIEEDG